MRDFYLSVYDRENQGRMGLWNPVEENELDFSTLYRDREPFAIRSYDDARAFMALLPEVCFFSMEDSEEPGRRIIFQGSHGKFFVAITDKPEPKWNEIRPVYSSVFWQFRKELNARIKKDLGIKKL